MKNHYDYCVLDLKHNNVTLFDKTECINIYPLSDTVIVDANILIDEHNNLVIDGERLIYEIATTRTNIRDLDNRPLNRYIQAYEPNKFMKFFGRKPYEYVYGWWAYRAKTRTKYILSNYKIKIV